MIIEQNGETIYKSISGQVVREHALRSSCVRLTLSPPPARYNLGYFVDSPKEFGTVKLCNRNTNATKRDGRDLPLKEKYLGETRVPTKATVP